MANSSETSPVSSARDSLEGRSLPVIRLNLWLETGEGIYFGMGRALLLAGIERHGSLRKAAEDLGMSYRAAWGKIKKTEAITGLLLIDKTHSRKDGYQLTEEGKKLLTSYMSWFDAIEKDAFERAEGIFPSMVRSHRKKRQP